jgi:hypothetical protein
MPDNEVKVSITGDDSGYRNAIQQLQQELNKLAGAKGPPIGPDLAAAGEGAHKAAGGVREAHEKIELFGKASEKVKDQIADFKKELVGFGLGFLGISTAFETVKRVFEEGAALETTTVRFQNLLGASNETKEAFEGLEKVSDETGISIGEIADSAESLYAAGQSVDHLAGSVDNLAKVAIITGSSLGEITDIFDRISAHGEVSFREIFRLTQATGGATRDLAIQYRDLPKQLEASIAAIDAAANVQDIATTKAEKHRTAIEDMGKQLGIADAAWKLWGRNINTVNAGTVIPGFGGEWAQRAAQQFLDDFNAGIKQLSAETGIAQRGIIDMVNHGEIGMDTLLSKGKEWRADLAERAKQPLELAKAQISATTQQQQFAILDTIKTKLTDVAGNADAFARASETWGQKVKVAAHEVEKAFEGVGLGWTTSLKPALDALANKDFMGAFGKLPEGVQLAIKAFVEFQALVLASKIPTFLKGIKELWEGIKGSTEAATAAQAAYNAEEGKGGLPGAPGAPGGTGGKGKAEGEAEDVRGPGGMIDKTARKVGPALPGLGEVGMAAFVAQQAADFLQTMSPTKGSEIQKKLEENKADQPESIFGWKPPWWQAEKIQDQDMTPTGGVTGEPTAGESKFGEKTWGGLNPLWFRSGLGLAMPETPIGLDEATGMPNMPAIHGGMTQAPGTPEGEAPMGTEPFKVYHRKPAAQMRSGRGDESLWEKSTWEQEADKGIRGSTYLPASAEAAGYHYEGSWGGGQVTNKQGQEVGTYDYFMAHLKEFQQASKQDDVGKKIDETNKLLGTTNDTLSKALTASGGT